MKLDFSLLEGLELSGVVELSDASWNPGLIRMAAEGLQKRLVKKSCKNAKPNLRNSIFSTHFCLY